MIPVLHQISASSLSPSISNSQTNLQDLVEQFINAQDVRDNSKKTYRRNICSFLNFLQEKSITLPTEEDVLAYKRHLIDREFSVLTINNHLTVVRLFFRYLKHKNIYEDIAAMVKMLNRSKNNYRDALSVDQIRDLMAAINRKTVKGKRDFAIINLLLRTGLRIMEVASILNEDLRKSGQITILKIQGKGRHEKNDTVVLTHQAVKPILIYQGTKNILRPKDPLFCNIRFKDQPITPRTISRLVSEYYKKAGIISSRLVPHSLRHSAVTLALEGGATLQETQAMARHHNINTTLVYAHNMDRIVNAAEFKIDKILTEAEVICDQQEDA